MVQLNKCLDCGKKVASATALRCRKCSAQLRFGGERWVTRVCALDGKHIRVRGSVARYKEKENPNKLWFCNETEKGLYVGANFGGPKK